MTAKALVVFGLIVALKKQHLYRLSLLLHVTNSWFLEPERGTQRVVIDTASGLDVVQFKKTLHESGAVIIPVLPSSIDIHAVAHFIADILLQGKFRREDGRLAVVANRARRNTLIYQQLEKFLNSLGIPFVATLRDTQQYIKASEAGLGVFDMPGRQRQDIENWQPLLDWLSLCEQKAQLSEHFKISWPP